MLCTRASEEKRTGFYRIILQKAVNTDILSNMKEETVPNQECAFTAQDVHAPCRLRHVCILYLCSFYMNIYPVKRHGHKYEGIEDDLETEGTGCITDR